MFLLMLLIVPMVPPHLETSGSRAYGCEQCFTREILNPCPEARPKKNHGSLAVLNKKNT